MKLKKYFSTKKLSINKKYFSCFLILLVILSLGFYCNYRYSSTFSEFKSEFDSYDFSKANNTLLTKDTYNPVKSIFIDKDLNSYFSNKLNNISNSLKSQDLSEQDALLQIKEIDRYSIISKDELLCVSDLANSSKESTTNFNNGVQSYDDGLYVDAINSFNKVSPFDFNYSDSLKYITKSKEKLKESLFATCDELEAKEYYSKAINLLKENMNIVGDTSDIEEKISELKSKQQEYYNKASSLSETSSSALTSEILPTNINTLNIQSNTPYFLNVNLENQKTYVYKGKADKWELIRTCPCSTGISSEPTPSGSFSIKEKGTWFFSNKFNQGGKYWTQITGDILFHSVPYAKDKSTVLDYTLNKPASHGCIRLSLEDAKWIYSTVPKGSKIIIK